MFASRKKPAKSKARICEDCIWADAFSVQVISNSYNITFLVVNEGTHISQSVISPDITSNSSNDNGYTEKQNIAQDGKYMNQQTQKYVVLHLSRKGHYNLIGYQHRWCFEKEDLPYSVREKFEIAVVPLQLHKRRRM